MASIFENKDRHVVPNWRSFLNTSRLGELNGSKTIQLDSSFKPDISDLKDEWSENKSLGMAGDILGVALVCNQKDDEVVNEVSQYVLSQTNGVTPALNKAAKLIGKEQKEEIDFSFEISNIQTFAFRENLNILYDKINWYKRRLRQNPKNPISWVELARLYSINGQDTEAERAIKNAIFLAPENRFVLRNMARFFIHIGDVDFAHEIVRKSNISKYDPWVMATEIALADLRGRGSRLTKKGISMIDSDTFHPFNITELASSIGTLELNNASIKESSRLFEKSILNPNDNSLAQIKWASQEESRIKSVDPASFNIVNSFEALARNAREHGDWNKAIDFAKNWFLDLPFSKGGVLFASEIARSKLKDHNKAVEIAMPALLSHPSDPELLNNIVYSLCIENRLDEAVEYLSQIKDNQLENNSVIKACLRATRGLFHFRMGQPEIGRRLYSEAMDLAQDTNKPYLHSLAFVNYAREEVLNGIEDKSQIILRLHEVKETSTDENVLALVQEVFSLIENK